MNSTWRAFAKINLDLRLGPVRADGYRNIRTTLQVIDLYDEIRVAPSSSFRFTATAGPGDDSNLVVRAVEAFRRETSMDVPLHLDLVKRIPAGAGLGGGSADAAVTLLGLARWFEAAIPGERMHRLLGELGSDVPFFALGGRALGVGRGDELFPLPDGADRWYVLIHPDVSVGTAEAYSWLTENDESNTILGFCARFVPAHEDERFAPEARLNDFETPLFRRFPELAEIKRKLTGCGARFAALSGSGATVYGQFSTEAKAAAAADRLGAEYRVTVARPVPRGEYFPRMLGG